MKFIPKSIRTFIGAENFGISRQFYTELGFKERVISKDMSLFRMGHVSFYLQDYYVKDWVDNSMIFLEVDNVDAFWNHLINMDLQSRFEKVRINAIKKYDWGKECFVHDPSGVLWHIGEFFENEK